VSASAGTLARRLLRNDFVVHGSLIFASTTLINICNYGFHLVVSRRLGVTGYGALASLLAALMLATFPAMISTYTVTKYASALHAVRDYAGLRTLVERTLLFSALIAAIACSLGFLARNPLASYLNLPDVRPVVLLTLIVSVQFIFITIRGVLQGVQDFLRFAIATVSEVAGKLVLGVGLVYAGFGVGGALFGYALATTLSLAYTISAIYGHLDEKRGPLRIEASHLLRTTSAIAASTASLAALGFIDVVLVKHYFDPHAAGLYGAVSLVGKALLFVASFVPTILLPKAAARSARGESPLPLLLQAGAATAAFAGIGLGVLCFRSEFTVAMMAGPAFVAAAPYVFPYGCAMALLGATTTVASFKIGVHQFDYVLPLVAIAVAEIVALTFLHRTLSQVVSVVLVAQVAAFICSLYRITAVRSPQPD
jgi:O-antigen/teichoic acid export membrane protein